MPAGIKGVDVYHLDQVDSFHNLAAVGIAFIFIKASQGIDSKDPLHDEYSQRATEAGLIRSSYHFFTPDDPLKQAAWFVECAGNRTKTLPLALDVETYFEGVGQAAAACAAELKRLTGRYPIIYSSDSFYQSYLKDFLPTDATLWIARYGGMAPVTACQFFQFSESGTVAGITGAADLDVFQGTLDELTALVS